MNAPPTLCDPPDSRVPATVPAHVVDILIQLADHVTKVTADRQQLEHPETARPLKGAAEVVTGDVLGDVGALQCTTGIHDRRVAVVVLMLPKDARLDRTTERSVEVAAEDAAQNLAFVGLGKRECRGCGCRQSSFRWRIRCRLCRQNIPRDRSRCVA